MRRAPHPLTRLVIAMGSAARNIADPASRRSAAIDAVRIPKCAREIGGGKKGEMARDGRRLLAQLADLPEEELADAAKRLRAYADAVASTFHVTSEVKLGDRRRRTG
jgi:hypothetical protein